MKVIIVGAGGQARVVYEILSLDRRVEVVAFVDNVFHGADERIMGVPVLGDHLVVVKLIKNGVKGAIIAIGDNKIRAERFAECSEMGLEMINAIAPTAHIAHSARIGKGVVLATSAIVSTGAHIGNNVIINTGAIVEHEDILEDHVHIGPGTVLAGRVTVKRGAFVGLRSVVKENITIGENVTVGAGSVVLENIPDNAVVAGSPARLLHYSQ
ncbi:MAG: acetyltransferase [Chloroflexi bacterium]|nr:acetyltransferase [Chloroflexota bacterium]